MSAKPVVILLLLTLALAMATFLVVKPPSASTSPGTTINTGDKLLELDAAKVSTLTIQNTTQTHTLTRVGDGWTWAFTDTPSAPLAPRPLDPTRVAAFLRMLADARAAGTVPPGETIPDAPAPIVLTITNPEGQRTLRFARRALGGLVLVDTGAGLALASDDLLAAMTNPGPSAWRPTRLLGEAALNATQITIAAQGEPITLRRNGQRWVLDTPVREQADATVVSKLLGALESLEIARYIDQPITPAQAGLDQPSARITLQRQARGDAAAQTTELLLGGPADASGTNLYASTDGGQSVVAVDASKLANLKIDAKDLVFRGISTHTQADVAGLRITAGKRHVTLLRQAERWTEQVDDAAPITQDPTRAAASLDVLTTILGVGADAVDLRRQPSAPVQAVIALLEPQGNTMQSIEVLERAPGAKAPRIFRTGSTERAFNRPPAELERWLGTLAAEPAR
jgi:hypothetical protein